MPRTRCFRDYLTTRSAASRGTFRKNATAALATSKSRSVFGRFAAVEPSAYTAKGSDHLSTLVPVHLDPKVLAGLAERLAKQAKKDHPIIKIKPRDPDKTAGAKYTKLGLFLKEVVCKETTSGPGDDEIAMGGVFTTPDGATHKIPRFDVREFDTDKQSHKLYPKFVAPSIEELLKDPKSLLKAGEKWYAAPGRKLAEWQIRRDMSWPTTYSAVLTMMEIDDGGFGELLNKLWQKVASDVKAYIEKGLKALGEAFLGKIGEIVGGAIAWIVNKFLDFLIALIGDDPDDHIGTIYLGLGAATKSYYDWTTLNKEPHHTRTCSRSSSTVTAAATRRSCTSTSTPSQPRNAYDHSADRPGPSRPDAGRASVALGPLHNRSCATRLVR